MRKFFILALLILAVGCSSNPRMSTNKHSALGYTSTKTPIITSTPHTTQASSISTPMMKNPTVSMKGSQYNNIPDWLLGDGANGLVNKYPYPFPSQYPGQYPAQQPTTQNPTTQNPTTQNPTTQNPTTQNPAEKAPSSSGQYEQQVLQLVNSERSKSGLPALSMDGSLSKMALVKAQDMINNNYFDHNSPTYGSPFDMMKQFNITYSSAGENIAKGQPTPDQVMKDWMNSPGHRANILKSSFTKIGVGYYKGAWVQEFTG
ncbi:CAP domain-containing protein [Paenibacillus sp. FSL K6-3182]|uniref:CAP domain-containing protein n=1 Tax=Paenibacillus sp. FSL K6-3182 TaxID=2921495 RepID=UPI0030D14429